MSTPPTRPKDRYSNPTQGTRGAGSKILVVAAVLLVLLVLVAGGRNLMQRQAVPVTAEFITQEEVDENTTRVWVDVTRRNIDEDSYCIVTALDYSFAEVGRREFAIPKGGDEVTLIEVEIPVREPAVSARVYGCSDKVPFYLDTSKTFTEPR